LPHRAFPVSQVADAFRHMAQAKHTGKVVVSIRDPEARIEEKHAKLSAIVRGTCLITGGLGGLGLAIAHWLVEKGAHSLALVGRRQPGEAAREAIEALRRAGARVHVTRGDVSSEADMRRVLVEVETDLPSVSGVIHAAGLLDDGILLQQTPERFASVMLPKVEGAWVLQTLLAERPHVPLILFSSVAGLLGLPGQGNYAAGNAFLDALACYRNARGEAGMAINWGPWADVGLAAARENRGQRLSLQGLPSLGVSDGLTALGALLEESVPQVAVARLDWVKYAAASPVSARSTLLAHLAVQKAASQVGSSAATDGLRERLLAAEAGSARRSILETYLREQVAQVLKLAPTRIDLNKPFRSLGLDSLMALELRNRLEAGLKVALPATLVWNYPTVAALAPHLAERLEVPLESEGVALAAPETDEVGKLLEEIERLSPEEARGLLDQDGARGDGRHG
jgi:NADP-dependent 3-hydroxy acid dehydrogenase YdfG/acyl carrier protein